MNTYSKRNLVFFITGLFIACFFVSPVFADGESTAVQSIYGQSVYGQSVYGQSVYGGGVMDVRQSSVLIDKFVQNPTSALFVDHLGLDDPRYRPGQIITFQITVNNPGDATVEKMVITDTMPRINNQPIIDFMTGPGAYNAVTGIMTFEVTNLEAGKSLQFEVKGKISHASLFSDDQNVICPDPGNVVTAQIGNRTEKDTSKFCIEKTFEIAEVPATGPAQWMAMFGTLISALTSGVYLRRNAR